MGFDAVHDMDSFDAALKEIAGDAIEVHLERNTIVDRLYSGSDEDEDFVAYHHLWVIFPAREEHDYPMHIAIAFLKEYRSKTPGKVDVAFKWVSEDNGPSAFDCPAEWLDRVPPPPVLWSPAISDEWRSLVRRRDAIRPMLSKAQRDLLVSVRDGGAYISGGKISTARTMAASELVTMRDDGPSGRFGRKWWVELTKRGHKIIS